MDWYCLGCKTENDCSQGCVSKIYDNTFKKFLGRKCSKLCFLLLKFAVPVTRFVVVELVPLWGGNECGTRPKHKILVPFRGVVEIFRRTPRPFYRGVPPGVEVYRLIKLLGSLSNSVFERQTSTGSGRFVSLGSGLVETRVNPLCKSKET